VNDSIKKNRELCFSSPDRLLKVIEMGELGPGFPAMLAKWKEYISLEQ
jgi:hypothetical protein